MYNFIKILAKLSGVPDEILHHYKESLMNTKDPTIVFLTAIPVEYQAVRVHLPEAPLAQQWDSNNTKLYEKGEYLTPQQTRCQIIVRQLEGMGNLVALSETKDVITQFQPNYLFFVGIAAKLKDVELGDVVVPPWIKGYETGKIQEDEWLSRAPVAFASKRLLEMVRHLARGDQWQAKIKPVPTPKKPKALVAPIVSGEKVVDSPEFLKQLRRDHSNAAAVEMEGLGFLHAICEAPSVEGIVIRGISDAGENKAETDKQGWQEKAASHAAAFAFAMLDELLDKAKELPPLPNPYPGLNAFRPEDAKNFFGRDFETQQLLAKVLANPLVVVIGASGSGKSSLVFAGLVPALASKQWLCLDFRIQENAPAQAPRALVLYAPPPQPTELAALTSKLSDTSLPLSTLVKNIFEESHYQKSLLIVIDQFEELYTVTSDKALQQRFLDWLLEAVERESLKKFTHAKLRVVLTLRVDFMKDGLAYPPFAAALNQGNDMLGPIAKEERIRQVIEGPAQGSEVTLEDGLTERILQDLQQQQEVPLPLLQFALEKLWEQQQEKKLTHVAYEEIGTLKGALSHYAETQYEELIKSGWQKKALQHIFTQLVYSATNTKRVATIEQIGPANWALVGKLADARLVITRRDEASQLETVELVHEVLISSWGSLSHWVDESREFRSWQDKLGVKIKEWKDDGALLHGARLVEAEEKLKQYSEVVTAGERAFIGASGREKQRQKRVWQGIFMLLLVLLGVAGWQWWEAKKASTLLEYKYDAVTQERNGNYQAAIEFYQQALSISQNRCCSRKEEANNRSLIGHLYDKLAQCSLALEYVSKAFSIRKEIGDPKAEAELLSIASIYTKCGQSPEAEQYYNQIQTVGYIEAIRGNPDAIELYSAGQKRPTVRLPFPLYKDDELRVNKEKCATAMQDECMVTLRLLSEDKLVVVNYTNSPYKVTALSEEPIGSMAKMAVKWLTDMAFRENYTQSLIK
jgi:nucleoside phosphorylase/uncharacterized glyoxalase superfamily protein PhnB